MSARKARKGVRQMSALVRTISSKATRGESICEQMEGRILLSGVTFATPTTLSLAGARAPLVVARLAGAGNPNDAVVATATAAQILTGSGTGTFSLGQSITLPANPCAESPFMLGDFSGTGTDDIVLNSFNTGTGDGVITCESNNGSAAFTAGAVTDITDGGAGFTPIAGKSGSFNGDANQDLTVVGKPGTDNELVLAVLISNGDGTFTESDIPITGSSAAGNTSNIQIVNTIANECIVYDGTSGNLDVFSGVGDGNLTQLTPVPLSASLITGGTFDGTQDIVVASGNQVTLLLNQGDGTFQIAPQGPITLPGTINAIDVGDFDLDGNNDIITNEGILFGSSDGQTFNATAQPLPISINGGGNVSNTVQAVFLGNSRQGFVGFPTAGNAVVSVVNTSPVGVLIDLESNNNPANPGSDVQLSASISSADANFTGTPTGTVTFFNGLTEIGSAPLSGGTATFDAGSTLDTGTNSITADYSGDATFGVNTSAPLTQTGLTSTVTTLTTEENPALGGDDVMFSAVVTGNDGAGDIPSGNVEFFDNGTDLGGASLDSSGTATFDTAGVLTVGSHPITAQYQGDDIFAASTSNGITQTINQPGLVPTVTGTTLPGQIVAGAKVRGKVTVAMSNQTSGTILADTITVFASIDGSIANAQPLVIDHAHGISIKAGQTKSLKLNVTSFPTSLGNGAFTLVAQVNSSLGQASNSAGGPTVNVAAPFVDLAASGATVKPASVKAGKSFVLTINLTNTGNISTALATVDVGLSIDGQTESTVLGSPVANVKIKPNKAGIAHVRVTIPSTVAAGTYQPFVTITDDGDTAMIIGTAFTVD